MPKPLAIPMMFEGWDSTVFKPKDGKDRPGLYLEECSYQAAKYAVEHWHYSGYMPAAVTSAFGVWEDSRYIGAVLFGEGAVQNIGRPFGLEQVEVCELVRVALSEHRRYVSQSIAIAIRLLKKADTRLRLVVSYADKEIGHHGGIYQAGNWIYVGEGKGDFLVYLGGNWVHRRAAHSLLGTSRGLDRRAYLGRHKYLYPLDSAMRAQIEPLRKPYPKCVGSADGGTTASQAVGGGSIPTATLREQ